jgi:hypothetical protein
MNPVLLTIPVFIAATLTLACGVLFAIIHQKDERIADLLEDKEISLKAITTMRKLYEVEIEVSKKLEDDLLEADKEYEAKAKENAKLAMHVGILQDQLTYANANLENLGQAVRQVQKYNDLIAMPRRKRETLIRELRTANVTVAKDVEP